jgi:glycine dehydrogenase
MILIREEIREIEEGKVSHEDSALATPPTPPPTSCVKIGTAPTPAKKPPSPALGEAGQVLAPVGRVDNVYGDRNLFCACIPWKITPKTR